MGVSWRARTVPYRYLEQFPVPVRLRWIRRESAGKVLKDAIARVARLVYEKRHQKAQEK